MNNVKPIVGFPGYYCCEQGNIYSTRLCGPTNGEKPLKKLIGEGKHYLTVSLMLNGKRHRKTIHRLVLNTLIPNGEKDMQCNHKNGNKKDNRLENLEWVTRSENALHSNRVIGRKTGPRKLTELQVKTARNLRNHHELTYKEIAHVFQVSDRTIWDLLNGRTWQY